MKSTSASITGRAVSIRWVRTWLSRSLPFSAGGENLAVRLTEPLPWKKFTLYRRVPSTGTIRVMLALTGLGNAHFDDLRIEPAVAR